VKWYDNGGTIDMIDEWIGNRIIVICLNKGCSWLTGWAAFMTDGVHGWVSLKFDSLASHLTHFCII